MQQLPHQHSRRWIGHTTCGPIIASLELEGWGGAGGGGEPVTLPQGASLSAIILLYNSSLAPVTLTLSCGIPPSSPSSAPPSPASLAAAAANAVLRVSGAPLIHLPPIAPGERLGVPLTLLSSHVGVADLSALFHVLWAGEHQHQHTWRRLVAKHTLVRVV
jgi:hypothetical protein